MQLELVEVLRTMAEVWHFRVTEIRPPFQDLEYFDQGLRKFLKPDFDFRRFGQQLLEKAAPNTFFLVQDELECQYVLFSLPDAADCALLCGPALRTPMTGELRRRISTKYGDAVLQDISLYYQRLPFDDGARLLLTVIRLCEQAYPQVSFRCVEAPELFSGTLDFYAPGMVNAQKVQTLQTRYRQERIRLEEQLVAAISMGDSKNALKTLADLERLPDPAETANTPAALQNAFLSVNALYRLVSGYNRAVHAEPVEQVYRTYLEKAESIQTRKDLSRLILQMVTSYCECIQNYTLGQYSPPIQQMVHYIHLHTEEALSLKFFSQMCNFSPSYLSNLFHKETGTTLTAYINQYRVERAVVLLQYSSLSIAQVGERVGFLDECYFTRIFKRLKGVSPSVYRKNASTELPPH